MTMQTEPVASVRLDLWLWAARFYKTRALAKHAIETGKVDLGGQRAKPSRGVRVGDALVVARGEERPDSDVDIMIEVDPEVPLGVYEYVELKDYIVGLFNGPVDVVNRDSLKPHIRPAVADAVYAF